MKDELFFPDAYDNEAAHRQLKLLMRQRKHLEIAVMDNEEVSVSCRGMARLRYQLNEGSWQWILCYLKTGDYEDFGISPSIQPNVTYEGFKEREVRKLIEQGCQIELVPFLHKPETYIELLVLFDYGKLFFSIKRNDEFINHLNDKQIW